MSRGFAKGLYKIPKRSTQSVSNSPPADSIDKEGFQLLVLLLILLAASPSLGVDSRYFFIIIMAIIGTGGFKNLI